MSGSKLPALLDFSDITTQSVLARQQAGGYKATEGDRNTLYLGQAGWSVNDEINLEKNHPDDPRYRQVLNPYYDPAVAAQIARLPGGTMVGQAVPDWIPGYRVIQQSLLDGYRTPSTAPAAVSDLSGNKNFTLGTVPQNLTTSGLANYRALEQRQTYEPQSKQMKLGG